MEWDALIEKNEKEAVKLLWTVDIGTALSSHASSKIITALLACVQKFKDSRAIQVRTMQLLQDIHLLSEGIGEEELNSNLNILLSNLTIWDTKEDVVTSYFELFTLFIDPMKNDDVPVSAVFLNNDVVLAIINAMHHHSQCSNIKKSGMFLLLGILGALDASDAEFITFLSFKSIPLIIQYLHTSNDPADIKMCCSFMTAILVRDSSRSAFLHYTNEICSTILPIISRPTLSVEIISSCLKIMSALNHDDLQLSFKESEHLESLYDSFKSNSAPFEIPGNNVDDFSESCIKYESVVASIGDKNSANIFENDAQNKCEETGNSKITCMDNTDDLNVQIKQLQSNLSYQVEKNKALQESLISMEEIVKLTQQQAAIALSRADMMHKMFVEAANRLEDLLRENLELRKEFEKKEVESKGAPAAVKDEEALESELFVSSFTNTEGFDCKNAGNIAVEVTFDTDGEKVNDAIIGEIVVDGTIQLALKGIIAGLSANSLHFLNRTFENEKISQHNVGFNTSAMKALALKVSRIFSVWKDRFGKPDKKEMTICCLRSCFRQLKVMDGRRLNVLLLSMRLQELSLFEFASVLSFCVKKQFNGSDNDGIIESLSQLLESSLQRCKSEQCLKVLDCEPLSESMAKEVQVMFNKERKALESIFHAYVPIVDGIVNEGNEALGMTFESFLSFAKDFDVCPQLMSLNEFKVIWLQTVRSARSAQDLSEAYLSYPQLFWETIDIGTQKRQYCILHYTAFKFVHLAEPFIRKSGEVSTEEICNIYDLP